MSFLKSEHWFYANTAEGFLEDAKKDGYIGEILENRFQEKWGRDPNLSLLTSWHASPPMLAAALEKGHVTRDQIVILEYMIDVNNRADAVIFGYSENKPNAIIVETKQWNEVHTIRASENPECIEMQFGERWIEMEHPSVQAKRYRERMKQVLEAKDLDHVPQINAYAYLHNCVLLSSQQLSVLRGEKFGDVFNEIPIYTNIYATALGNRIREKTKQGNGIQILKELGEI